MAAIVNTPKLRVVRLGDLCEAVNILRALNAYNEDTMIIVDKIPEFCERSQELKELTGIKTHAEVDLPNFLSRSQAK